VSDGGLAVALAELVTDAAGADVTLPDRVAVFEETPGRLVVQTTDPEAVAELAGELPVLRLGEVTTDGALSLSVGDDETAFDADTIRGAPGRHRPRTRLNRFRRPTTSRAAHRSSRYRRGERAIRF